MTLKISSHSVTKFAPEEAKQAVYAKGVTLKEFAKLAGIELKPGDVSQEE